MVFGYHNSSKYLLLCSSEKINALALYQAELKKKNYIKLILIATI